MSAEQKCRYCHPLQFISFVYMCGTGGRVKGQAIYDFFSQTSLSVARGAFAETFFTRNEFHEFPRTTALGRRIPRPCLVKSRRFDPSVKDLINPVSFALINTFGSSNGLERIAVPCIFRVEHNPPGHYVRLAAASGVNTPSVAGWETPHRTPAGQ